jgi:tocopherol O-methyltransferase
MGTEQEHREMIQKYYTVAQPYYRFLWHRDSLGLHYGFWEDGVKNKTEAITKENEVLADLAGIKQGDLVLDAGCGIGGSGIWLAKERGTNVVGLNIVDRQLIRGRDLVEERDLEQKIDFIKGDYQNLPFKTSSFDVFWAVESVEHATNLERFTGEAFRVLKPGGKIIIAATFLGNKKEVSSEEARKMLVGREVAGCFNDFRSAEQNVKIMKTAGFTDVQNLDKTDWIMKSARKMTRMCRLGLPVAKILSPIHNNFRIIAKNNEWGTYQEELFKSRVTSYNILLARKP